MGPKSKERLATCHELLQRIVTDAARQAEFSVICGHRGQKEQDEAFDRGNSKLRWPQSKHNHVPSLAVDLLPLPTQWADRKAFERLAVIVKGVANAMRVRVRWGGDWNDNGRSDDEKFYDGAHFELVKYKNEKGEWVML
jgi:hypothetical protein